MFHHGSHVPSSRITTKTPAEVEVGVLPTKMEETIKQHLEWLREDESRIVQTVKDSATHNALLRICNHLQFILSKLEEK